MIAPDNSHIALTTELSRHEAFWDLGSASLRHSLDANGDLSTLAFTIRIRGDHKGQWRNALLVPRPLFLAMGGDCFDPARAVQIDGRDNEYLGAFRTCSEDDTYAVLRSSPPAIFRMAQLMTAHRDLCAIVQTYATPGHTEGLITGFSLLSIPLNDDE